jgi:hypothetical protein
VKKNPESLVACKIHVEKQGYPEKFGERDAIVAEQTLKIVMDAPYAVEPVIPPTTVNAPRTENQKEFIVCLTRGGRPVANHPFYLTTNYIYSSGGHQHINSRPENRENYGHFILRRLNNTHVNRPYNGITQENGQELFYYISSIFGDSMSISVKSSNPIKEKFLKDSVMIIERIRDLSEIGTGTTYELVGNPDNPSGTNDPCRPIPPASLHYRNHYGTLPLLTAIQNIATSYDSLHPGIRLRINDMSLEYGGLFDLGNNWMRPHGEHRRGINADIGFSGISNTNQCVTINRRQLRILIFQHTQVQPFIEGDHFHIYSN